jgi:hypothetical protein
VKKEVEEEENVTQFSSKRYKEYNRAKKGIFWLGAIYLLSLVYWIVRVFVYIINARKPKAERVNSYTTQTYVFGWMFLCAAIVMGLYALYLLLYWLYSLV